MGGWVCVRNRRQTADSSQPLRRHFSSSTHPHHESRSNPIPHSTFSNQQPAYYRLSPRVLEYIFATFGARDCALAARFVVFCAFPAKQSSSSSPVASRSHLAITQHLATNLAAPERGSLSVALSASFGALFAGRKRGIGQFEIRLWENGGHNGAAGSNNTFFLHTNVDNPNTARPASRVFRFLRALFFAQIYSHRAPGYQPDTFTRTLCAPTRKLARFPQLDKEARHFYHGYPGHFTAKEAHAFLRPVAESFGLSHRPRHRNRCGRPRSVARPQARPAFAPHGLDGWCRHAHHTCQNPPEASQ